MYVIYYSACRITPCNCARFCVVYRLWYVAGKLHRDDDLPAVIADSGFAAWYCHGKLHREDGPAFVAGIERPGFGLRLRDVAHVLSNLHVK